VPLSAVVDVDGRPAVNGGLTPQHDQAMEAATEHMQRSMEATPPQASIDVDNNHSPDEASQAFQKQINNLRGAEAIQRQRQSAPAPRNRAERLLHYRNMGYSEDEAHHLNRMQENPDITARAYMAAKANGLVDENSQIFHDSVRHQYDLISATPRRRAGRTRYSRHHPRMNSPMNLRHQRSVSAVVRLTMMMLMHQRGHASRLRRSVASGTATRWPNVNLVIGRAVSP
jgi:hypothetical protein